MPARLRNAASVNPATPHIAGIPTVSERATPSPFFTQSANAARRDPNAVSGDAAADLEHLGG
jgi:hypothetical protein